MNTDLSVPTELGSLSKTMVAQISDAPKRFSGWYVPVFKTNPDDSPYHYGTAFGLDIDGALYLVTAAHVLGSDVNNPSDEPGVGLVFCAGRLVNLSPFDQFSIRLLQDGELVDIVAVQPRNLNLRDVFTGFFKREDIYLSDLGPNLYIAACGFPETKNRRASWAQKLAQRPYAYFGRVSEDSKRVALGFNAVHFCVDFNVRWTFKNGFGGFKAPDPHGISGGPVFVVHDFNSPFSTAMPLLVGVGIESRQPMGCFVCVNVQYLIQALTDAGGA